MTATTASVAAVLLLAAAPATAQSIASAYTDIDLTKCVSTGKSGDEGGEWASWSCKGYAGTPVRVFEGDLRFSVSYGSAAEKQCAAGQTFGAFNRLGPTIEWRLEDGKPFATILRWHTETEDERGSWLVVTRLSGAEACHMGYVDAALPGANTLARRLADLMARSFDCNADVPEVVARKKVDLAQLVSGDCGNK